MSTKYLSLIAVVVAGLASAGPSHAAATNGGAKLDFPGELGGATVKGVRVAAVIGSNGEVVRSAGVAKVTHPSVGVYCIKHSIAKLDAKKAIATVAVDWSHSLGSENLVQWVSPSGECPGERMWFEVFTYSFTSGSAELVDTVGFSIIVP